MDLSTRALFNSIVLLVLSSAVTFAAAWFWFTKTARAKEQADTLRRVAELETQLKLVGQTILPLSAAFQAVLVKQLTHYHTPEMDALMVKLGPPYTLTPGEAARLGVLLEERTRDMGDLIDEAERDAARMLPMVMKRVASDVALETTVAPELRFVAVRVSDRDPE